jgi:hypothetical protein
MGNCSPKTFQIDVDEVDALAAFDPLDEQNLTSLNVVWSVDGPSILPEPLEAEYTRKPLYEPIWVRPIPPDLEPLKPLDFKGITPFKGKLAPLKLF